MQQQFLFIDTLWPTNNVINAFWSHSPIARAVASLMPPKKSESAGVRLLVDFIIGFRAGDRGKVIGHWHKDTTSFDIVGRDSASGRCVSCISCWLPLSNIDSTNVGGSIYLVNRTDVEGHECDFNGIPDSEDCHAYFDKRLHEVVENAVDAGATVIGGPSSTIFW